MTSTWRQWVCTWAIDMQKRIWFPSVALTVLAAGLGLGQEREVPAADPDRKIASQDLLQIVIVGEVLPTEYRVSASGTINFPFLEIVEVQGLTPREVDLKLTELLCKDYFVKPEVLVDIREYRQDYVRMIGEVNKPGPMTLRPEQRMDILDALSFAGGTTRMAKNEVEFIRDGQRQVFSIEKLKRETDPAKKIWLRPGDIIEVKERIW
jgi:polysaccharide biosynthesis/export protein VpsN